MSDKFRPYPWIKIERNYLTDSKFMRLPDATKWHYLGLYLLAGESDAGGSLYKNGENLGLDDICFSLRCDVEDLQKSLDLLFKAGLVSFDDGISVVRFMDEQGPDGSTDKQIADREKWKARQQRKRNKDLNKEENKEEQKKEKEENKEQEKEEEESKNRIEERSRRDTSNVTRDNSNVTRDISVTSNDDEISSLVTESFRDLAESYYDQRHNFNQDLERLISFVEKVNPDQETINWLFERTKKNFRTVDDIFDKGIDVLIDNLVEKTGYVEETELPF